MRNYFKRLKAHPGAPVATVLSAAFPLAALGNENSPGGAMTLAMFFAALVWTVVLWTARDLPLPDDKENSNAS